MNRVGPKVSIIVPFFNAENYIHDVAENLLNQSERNIEMIFVNDGSTDASEVTLRTTIGNDSRCHILKQGNLGPGEARNLGISMARGEYILFLDADDLFDKELVALLYNRAKETDADITICRAKNLNVQTGLLSKNRVAFNADLLPKGIESFYSQDVGDSVFQICGAVVWNKLFKRSFINDNELKFPQYYYAEDMSFLFAALLFSPLITYTLYELVTHRVNQSQSLCGRVNYIWKSEIQAIVDIKRMLVKTETENLYGFSLFRRIVNDFIRLFQQLTDSKSFKELYEIAKNDMIKDFRKYGNSDGLSKPEKIMVGLILDSRDALDFSIKLYYERKDNIPEHRFKYWKFPYCAVPFGSKVVIYGAGDVGTDFVIQLKETGYAEVVSWIDKEPGKFINNSLPVYGIDSIATCSFDYIIIAIRNEQVAGMINYELMQQGIPEKKIVSFFPSADRIIPYDN